MQYAQIQLLERFWLESTDFAIAPFAQGFMVLQTLGQGVESWRLVTVRVDSLEKKELLERRMGSYGGHRPSPIFLYLG